MRRAPGKFGLLVVCCRGVACTGRRRLRPGGVHLRRRCTGICSSRSGRRILAVGGPGTPSGTPTVVVQVRNDLQITRFFELDASSVMEQDGIA